MCGRDLAPSRLNTRLAGQVPAYLDSCRQHVLTLRAALDRSDFEAVILLGHNMRGAGGAFGFQAITDLGASLEQAGDLADLAASRRLVEDLSLYLDSRPEAPLRQ